MRRIRLVIAVLLSACLCVFAQENASKLDNSNTRDLNLRLVYHNGTVSVVTDIPQTQSGDEAEDELAKVSDRLTKYLESIGTVEKEVKITEETGGDAVTPNASETDNVNEGMINKSITVLGLPNLGTRLRVTGSFGDNVEDEESTVTTDETNDNSDILQDTSTDMNSKGELVVENKEETIEQLTEDGENEENMEVGDEQIVIEVTPGAQREPSIIIEPLDVLPNPMMLEGNVPAPLDVLPNPMMLEGNVPAPLDVLPNPMMLEGNGPAPLDVLPNPMMLEGNGPAPLDVLPNPMMLEGNVPAPLDVLPNPTMLEGNVPAPLDVLPNPTLLEGNIVGGQRPPTDQKVLVSTSTIQRVPCFGASSSGLQRECLMITTTIPVTDKGATNVSLRTTNQNRPETYLIPHVANRVRILPSRGYPYPNPVFPYPLKPVPLLNRRFFSYPYPNPVRIDTDNTHKGKIVKRHIHRHRKPHLHAHAHQAHLHRLECQLQHHPIFKHGFLKLHKRHHSDFLRQKPKCVPLLGGTGVGVGVPVKQSSTLYGGWNGVNNLQGSTIAEASYSNKESSGYVGYSVGSALGGGLQGSIGSSGLSGSLGGSVGSALGGGLQGSIGSSGLSGSLGGSVGGGIRSKLKRSITKRDLSGSLGGSVGNGLRGGLGGSIGSRGLSGSLGGSVGSALRGGLGGAVTTRGLSGSLGGSVGSALRGGLGGGVTTRGLSGSLGGSVGSALRGGLGGAVTTRGISGSLGGSVGSALRGGLRGGVTTSGLSGSLGGSVGSALGGGLGGSISSRGISGFVGGLGIGLQGSISPSGLFGFIGRK